MPTENRIGRHNGRDVHQQPASQAMAQFGKAPSLLVVKLQSPPLQPRLQYPVLFPQERDDVLLLSLKPTAQGRNQELERKHV